MLTSLGRVIEAEPIALDQNMGGFDVNDRRKRRAVGGISAESEGLRQRSCGIETRFSRRVRGFTGQEDPENQQSPPDPARPRRIEDPRAASSRLKPAFRARKYPYRPRKRSICAPLGGGGQSSSAPWPRRSGEVTSRTTSPPKTAPGRKSGPPPTLVGSRRHRRSRASAPRVPPPRGFGRCRRPD